MRDPEILLIDDDPRSLKAIGWALEYKGYQVTSAPDGPSAMKVLESQNFDLVMAKLNGKKAGTLAALSKAREVHPDIRVILLSNDHSQTFPVEAYDLDVDDYIFKPCRLADLYRRVGKSLEKLEIKRRQTRHQKQLRDINESMLNMLMIMSHDIRGSLVSMGATLKMLKRGAFGQAEAGVLEKLEELSIRAKRLTGIAEDFLGKTGVAAGHVEIKPEAVDLKLDVVDPVLEELSFDLKERRVEVDNRLTGHPLKVKGSKTWLRSVFRNLFKNAMDHGGPGGKIEVGFEDQGPYFRLRVYNTGEPIPLEKRSRLFSKAGRPAAGAGQVEGHPGMGLGLSLIQDVIKKHGGDIWYESKGEGSNFVFTLPTSTGV